MRADELRLDELVTFSDGHVSLHGRRLILHAIHAMAQFRRDLIDTVGREQSRRILSRFGYFWGEVDAAAMRRIFEWESPEEWLKAMVPLQRLEGVGKTELGSLDLDPEGSLRMELVWKESAECQEQLIEFGTSPESGCWILEGYASGYASFCLNRPVYCIEQTCRARGDSTCTALVLDRESWGDDIRDFQRYFQADDIQKKIQDLTNELRKKTLELARHRKLLQRARVTPSRNLADIRSKAFGRVLDVGARVARFDSSVLITGESGVGKEVVARFIHDSSPRRNGPFVAVNCGALPGSLLESELFGHKAGSFTGAVRDRAGLFEEANTGTMLLDEIGDIELSLQVKLLRVLQEKKIRRVGENTTRDVDVRVIAATHRHLEEEVRAERFREDLFYRLRVVEIDIPPLRERSEDVLPLARHFIDRLSKRLNLPGLTLDGTSIDFLHHYPWPGNVRELENALEWAAVMSEDGRIRPEHLPPAVRQRRSPEPHAPSGGLRTLADLERDHILAVLDAVGGNRAQAARALGIGATTLWRKLKAWEQSS